jgi:PAS domain S-box-containing protein
MDKARGEQTPNNALPMLQSLLEAQAEFAHTGDAHRLLDRLLALSGEALPQELRPQRTASLEHLRLALASLEGGEWEWKPSTQELSLSRRWLALLGYEEGELPPTWDTWRHLCHPEDRPEAERLLHAYREAPAPQAEWEYRARHKSGGWTWFRRRARAVERDVQGRPLRVLGTDVDITASKRGEERLNAVLRAIPDLIFRMREDGTYIDFIDGGPEETKLPPEGFLGRNIRELPLPQHFIDKTLRHLEHTIREGTLNVFEYELEMPRGLQHYEARLLRSGPDEAVCIVRNTTERKVVEQQRLRLLQSEKMASLGLLASGIAHEIKNPVGYVTANLNMLGHYTSELAPRLQVLQEVLGTYGQARRLPSLEVFTRLHELWKGEGLAFILQDMPELIQESLTGTRRIQDIVHSLRAFSREDTGPPQAVDLNAELESTLRMVWSELKYKCEVRRELGPLPPVTCHPTQIAQVFTNLLVNAAQAMEAPGEIRVRTWYQDSRVGVEISDTGKGMTAETLSKLFTPFFTTKPRGVGTGLGLSISRDIVVRHGGCIEVRSEPGKGSTFTVHLPTAGAR